MKKLVIAALTLSAVLLQTPVAEAYYCCVGYRGDAYYRTHPNYDQIRRLPPPPNWSLGAHISVLATSQVFGEEGMAMGGLGAHLRYRGYRFGLELAADAVGNNTMLGGTINRLTVPIQLNLMFYLVPEGPFNLYLTAGGQIAATRIRLNYLDFERAQTFTQAGFQGGGGFEVNLGHRVSFLLDVRCVGLMRLDNEEPGAYYPEVENPILPEKEVGLQFNLGGSIRW